MRKMPLLPMTPTCGLSGKEIPDPENAFYYFRHGIDALIAPDTRDRDAYRKFHGLPDGGSEWDDQFVRSLVDKNQLFFRLVDHGISCDQFAYPKTEGPLAPSPVNLSRCLSGGILLYLKAINELHDGNAPTAIDSATKAVLFGNSLESDGVTLIGLMAAQETQEMAYRALRQISAQTDSSAPPQECIRAIGKRPPDGLSKAFAAEYSTLAQTIDKGSASKADPSPSMLSNRLAKPGYLVKPNQTKKMLSEHFRLVISASIGALQAGHLRIKGISQRHSRLALCRRKQKAMLPPALV